MRSSLVAAAAISLVLAGTLHACAQNVPVPARCTPDVNAQLGQILATRSRATVDNVMVCGTTISSSRHRRGGIHGDHQILPLRVVLPDRAVLVEVVTNDDLDERVTAPREAQVFAFGQLFVPAGGRFAAGVHDVHCSTHRGAANGWVVVNGTRYPRAC